MSDLAVTTATGSASASAGDAAAASSASSTLSAGQLLVLVLDMNPNQSHFSREPKSLLQWLDAALALLNSHLLLHPNHEAACVAAHSQSCSYLYPEDGPAGAGAVVRQRDGQFEGFLQVESVIRRRAAHILRQETQPGAPAHSDSLLSGALSLALAYVHRRQRELAVAGSAGELSARVLVLSASGDTATQYMNYMNVFFSAQKMAVPIDTCMLDRDSGLLQQGADITGGIYRQVKHFPSLLQFLLWMYLPDAGLKQKLSLPSLERVDYRAACFCHRQLIDVGYVCSVCLSIFCKLSPICTTCDTVFKIPVRPLPAGGGKKKKSNNHSK